jgi:nitrogen fixation protein NifZ
MNVDDLDLGDVVYAAHTILDDGSMPGRTSGDVLVQQGSRGVIVKKGYLENDPNRSVFLVRFEDEALNLGLPIGCWSSDLLIMETA